MAATVDARYIVAMITKSPNAYKYTRVSYITL